jgi:hypothetical protein
MIVSRCRVLPWLAWAVVLVALCGIKLQQLVDFHRDAQYYVQASLLWPQGQVGFAGSLIGGRDLVVLAYHRAMVLLGANTDALAVAMGFLFGCCCLLLAVVCQVTLRCASSRAWAAIASASFAFLLTAWSYPASDGPGVTVLAAMWATWAAWLRWRRPWLLWMLMSLLAGLSTHVRSELALFALAAGVLAVAPQLVSADAAVPRWRVVLATAAAAGVFLVGTSAPNVAWPVWVPAAKPYVYTYVFPLYRAMEESARGSNGEASAELSRVLGLGAQERIPFWPALAKTYVEFGPRESDRLVARAALEGLRAAPTRFIANVARTLCAEPCSGASVRPVLAVELGRLGERRERQAGSLAELDAVRRSHSAQFGNDPVVATARLAEGSIPWVERLRGLLGGLEVNVAFPFVAVPTLALVLGAIAALRPGQRALLLPVIAYAITLCVLVAATQGGGERYLEGALLLEAVALTITGFALPASRRRPPAL